MTRTTREDSVAVLGDRLRAAIESGANGSRNGNGNGNGAAIRTPSDREVAIDVCRAILAEAGAGTAEHSDDVVLIAEALGERMGLTGPAAEDLLVAARLHDIGKAWVPKRILEKTGPLTDREWGVMRQHTLVGEEILSPVGELAQVGHLVRHSHERWDGTGYPDGLRGEGIPLGSRIIFCADTFHAIRSDRPYRPGRSADEALAEIRRCAGTQFDPTVANALEEVVRERRSRPRGARSSRLLALVMCLVIGGAGTALAHSDLLGESGGAPPSRAPAPPRGCGNVACSRVAAPVGGLGPVGALGSSPGPRPLHPGLPGRLHGRIAGKLEHANGASGHGASQPAKNDHPEKGNGRALGHSGESHGASQPTGATNAAVPSSSSHAGGSGGRGHHSGHSHHTSGGSSGGSHHTSGGNSGGSHHASGGSSGGSHGRGGSHGSHGSGGSNGASHGNSGKDGGSSGSHGK